jgi:hypothetical protein
MNEVLVFTVAVPLTALGVGYLWAKTARWRLDRQARFLAEAKRGS